MIPIKEQAREIVDGAGDHFWRDGHDVLRVTADFDKIADRIASALASRDTEVREVLEGLQTYWPDGGCWCGANRPDYKPSWQHLEYCLAARKLYEKVSK